jgi:outer membrane protein TolC
VFSRIFMIGMLCCIHPLHAQAETLQQAMEHAVKQHPMLQMAEQGIAAARGNLTEQEAYAYNPELSLEPQRRSLNGGGSSNDYYITLSQGIEMAGKRDFRRQSAEAALDVASKGKQSTAQQVIFEVARAFVGVYFAQRTFDLRQQHSQMLKKVSHAVAQQLALGQSSQLQANLAASAFASAQNSTTVAKQALAQSKQRYWMAQGIVAHTSNTQNQAILPKLSASWQPPKDAYQLALASRPDFATLHAQQALVGAQVGLASAARTADISINAMVGREAGENLIKVGVTIPFSVLNTHQGAYRAALAKQERVDTGIKWSQQQLRYAVQTALENHANAMSAFSAVFSSQMQQHAQGTIVLAQQAYDAGELDLEEWVVHIRQGLDAQMTALDIIKQAWLARIRLAEVLGKPDLILKGTQS